MAKVLGYVDLLKVGNKSDKGDIFLEDDLKKKHDGKKYFWDADAKTLYAVIENNKEELEEVAF